MGTFSTVSQGQLPQTMYYDESVTSTIGGTTYVYVLGTPSVSTVYRATIDTSGNIGTFSTASQGQLPQTMYVFTTVTSTIGGTTYVYVLGGNSGSRQSTVYKATIDTSGNMGTFSTASQGQLPQVLDSLTSVTSTIGGTTYVYVLGGNSGSYQSTVYKATIDTSGNIGAFSTASQGQLPTALTQTTTVTTGNYIYVLGGLLTGGTTAVSTVYLAQIDTSGNVGTFSTVSQGQLPQLEYAHTNVTAITGSTSYIYVLGGYNTSTGTTSTVYKAQLATITATTTNTVNTALTILNTGALTTASTNTLRLQASGSTAGNGNNGSIYFLNSSGQTAGRLETTGNTTNGPQFSTTGQAQLPQTLSAHANATATIGGTNYIYMLGGDNANTATNLSTVYKATIDTSGNVGTFSTVSQGQLQIETYHHTSATATIGGTSYIYVLGGVSGTGFNIQSSSVYKATIDTSGNVGTFSVGGQGQLPSTLYSHGTTTATIGGTSYIYVLGGNATGSDPSGNRSTVYKATINTSGNIGAFSTVSQGQLPQAMDQLYPNVITATIGGTSYIYVLGGSAGGVAISTVYKATIDTSGNIGAFSTVSQGQLPSTRFNSGTMIASLGGTSYVWSMTDGNSGNSTVYKATIDTSGNIGTFSTVGIGQFPTNNSYSGDAATVTIGSTTYGYAFGEGGNPATTVYRVTLTPLGYGTLYIGGVDTVNADIAENYSVSDPNIGPADIVSLPSSDSAELTKSTTAYDQHLFGVISTKPGIILGSNDSMSQDPNQRPVALKGRVPVKVSVENGPINIGDTITSSSTPGVGMKATRPGQIIGNALEPFSCSTSNDSQSASESASFGLVNPTSTCQGTIIVFINVGYNDPTPAIITTLDQMSTFAINIATNSAAVVTDNAGNVISRTEVLAGAVVGNLQAGVINAQSININGQSLRDYIASVVNDLGLTISGQNNNIISPIASIDQIHTGLISPEGKDAAIALKLDDNKLSVLNGNSASASAVASIDNQGNATFSGQLSSNSLQTGDASISGTLHAGKIIADNIVGLKPSVINNVTNVYNSTPSAIADVATASSLFNNSSNLAMNYIDISSFSGQLNNVDNLIANTATFNQGLMSFGETSLSDTAVAGQLSINGSLILADNSINVLGNDLQIQPLRQGGLSVMAGLFYIDTNGNIKVGGNAEFAKDVKIAGTLSANVISPIPGNDLTLATGNSNLEVKNASNSSTLSLDNLGNVIASGSGTFGKLNLSLIQPAFALSTTEVVATGSAGTAVISAHQTELTIDNPLVTDKSLIYVTPRSNQIIYLMRQVPGVSFTVGISSPLNIDVPFNWIIVN